MLTKAESFIKYLFYLNASVRQPQEILMYAQIKATSWDPLLLKLLLKILDLHQELVLRSQVLTDLEVGFGLVQDIELMQQINLNVGRALSVLLTLLVDEVQQCRF